MDEDNELLPPMPGTGPRESKDKDPRPIRITIDGHTYLKSKTEALTIAGVIIATVQCCIANDG
jgi:hypothetical protein